MKWQMIVIIAQLGVGGGLVVAGLRKAAHYYLAHTNPRYAERLAGRIGGPVVRPMRQAVIGLALALIGALMLATIYTTADLLLPSGQID